MLWRYAPLDAIRDVKHMLRSLSKRKQETKLEFSGCVKWPHTICSSQHEDNDEMTVLIDIIQSMIGNIEDRYSENEPRLELTFEKLRQLSQDENEDFPFSHSPFCEEKEPSCPPVRRTITFLGTAEEMNQNGFTFQSWKETNDLQEESLETNNLPSTEENRK